MKLRVIAEWILFLLSTVIHDEYFGSLILIALMLLLAWGTAERVGVFHD